MEDEESSGDRQTRREKPSAREATPSQREFINDRMNRTIELAERSKVLLGRNLEVLLVAELSALRDQKAI